MLGRMLLQVASCFIRTRLKLSAPTILASGRLNLVGGHILVACIRNDRLIGGTGLLGTFFFNPH